MSMQDEDTEPGYWRRVDRIIGTARDEARRHRDGDLRQGNPRSAVAVILAERLAKIVELHILHGFPGQQNWCEECGELVTYPDACTTGRLCLGDDPT